MIRKIILYGNYFKDFFEKQSEKIKRKIDYVLYLIATEERVPVKFLKHIEGSDGLYEIRITVSRNRIRIFCFLDEGKLIIVLNGFQKKSQKTPKNEIALAEKLKKEYFDEKSKRR
jgi:phage-related protein